MADRSERLLAALAADIEWPDADLATRVRAQIESGARPARVRWQLLPRLGLVTACVVALTTATILVASPAARRAVADLLGIGGVRVTYGGPTPSPAPRTGAQFDFGEEVSLDEARARADFDVSIPEDPTLGAPDAVYFDDFPPGGYVALVYGPRPGLPAVRDSDAAIVFTMFRADVDPELGFFKKIARDGVEVQGATVNGLPAYWLAGEPHFFIYRNASGKIRNETVRLVGNVLLWERDGVTFRLEVGDRSLERALRIASSVN